MGKADGYRYPQNAYAYDADDDRYKVGFFSHLDQVVESKPVQRGATVTALKAHEPALELTYQFQGKPYTVDDFLDHQRITGLIVAKDGKIVVERYQYDRRPEMHFVSFSMAKSVISVLIGCAFADGKITSLDDKAVAYEPRLAGTAFADVTIRNLLRMSSGAKIDQGANSGVDRDRINRETFNHRGPGGIKTISWITERSAPQGVHFKYSNADTYVLGLVLQAATGRSIVDYTSEKLWQAIGAEDDGAWLLDASGMAIAHAGFNARLRDYARIGVMLANDGLLEQAIARLTDLLRTLPSH